MKASLPAIGAIATTHGAAQVVLLALVPVLQAQCGLDLPSIGLIVAVGTACFMVAGPAWGALGDRWGRKRVVVSGLVGSLLAQGLFLAVLLALVDQQLAVGDGVMMLVGCRVLYGLTAAAVYPGCQAWVTEGVSDAERLGRLAGLSAASNLGRVIGPVLTLVGLLAGPVWPLFWLVVLPMLSLALALSVQADKPMAPAAPIRRPVLRMPGPGLRGCLFIALLTTTAVGQLQMLLGPVLTDRYGLDAGAASSVAAVVLLCVAVIGVATQWLLVRRIGSARSGLLAGALLMVVSGVGIWPLLGTGWAALPLGLFVVGLAIATPGYTAWGSHMVGQARRGQWFGWLAIMHTAGYTAGFAIAGWLYAWRPDWPLAGFLAALLGVALVAGTLRRRGDDSASLQSRRQRA